MSPASTPAGIHPDPPIDPFAFRKVVGHFPTGVTVATTLVDGVDHAMTASAFTSVSLEPALVLLCVDKEARFRDAVLEAGSWAVSFLPSEGRRAAEWFATRGRPLVGQLDQYAYRRGAATGAALLEPALGWLECRTTAVHDGGDHDIVLATVLTLELGTARESGAAPLLYYRGRYRELS